MNDLDDQIARHAKGYIEWLERDLADAEARIEAVRKLCHGSTTHLSVLVLAALTGEADDE